MDRLGQPRLSAFDAMERIADLVMDHSETPAWLSKELEELAAISVHLGEDANIVAACTGLCVTDLPTRQDARAMELVELEALEASLVEHNMTAEAGIQEHRAQLVQAELELLDKSIDAHSEATLDTYFSRFSVRSFDVFRLRALRRSRCRQLISSVAFSRSMFLVGISHVALVLYLSIFAVSFSPDSEAVARNVRFNESLVLQAVLCLYLAHLALIVGVFRFHALSWRSCRCTAMAALFLILHHCIPFPIPSVAASTQVSHTDLNPWLLCSILPKCLEFALFLRRRRARRCRARRDRVASCYLRCLHQFALRCQLVEDRFDIDLRLAKLCIDDIVVACYPQHEGEAIRRVRCAYVSGDDAGVFEVPAGEDTVGPWLGHAIKSTWSLHESRGSIRLSLASPDGTIQWSSLVANGRVDHSPSPISLVLSEELVSELSLEEGRRADLEEYTQSENKSEPIWN